MPKQVTLEVPDDIVDLCGSSEAWARRARELVVLNALRERRTSTGRAAELLEISLWELHELAAQHEIPMVEMSADELKRELQAAEEVLGRRTK